MARVDVANLQVRRLVWNVPSGRAFTFDTEVVDLPAGRVAAAVAGPAVATALVDVLVGLATSVAGEIRIGGAIVSRLPPGRRPVALVPLDDALISHLTVGENIAVGLPRRHSARYRWGRAHRLAQALQLDAVLDRRPHGLSPNQRARVAVARAMSADPALVVIEDRAGHPPRDGAVAAAADLDVAVLVVTDREERVRPYADRVHAVKEVTAPQPGEAATGDPDGTR